MKRRSLDEALCAIVAAAHPLSDGGLTIACPHPPDPLQRLAFANHANSAALSHGAPEQLAAELAQQLSCLLFVISFKPLFADGSQVGRLLLYTANPGTVQNRLDDELSSLALTAGAWLGDALT